MNRMAAALLLTLPLTAHAQDFSKEQICKATIAVEMGRQTEGMAVVEGGDTPVISYRRADDGKRFTFGCKVSGNRVVWRGYFHDEKSWGRWRNDVNDAMVTFTSRGDELTITSDMVGTKTFKHSQL